ncbi:allantoicase [Nakamurella endophytica]|uniref:Probable allantoicase n=1 Tax=Nakamurella endophytica TaxID=1748367 RepID=A0A917WKL7_9ACTN|nr:allantoicase [Nakamurella endophytica]GGM11103.1 putative allantoicase [Nakamurella endophytica]
MTRTDLDLASRALGGSVRLVSDEFFAPGEALLDPVPPVHDRTTFGPHGKIYDGWETRRRRSPGHDWAVVALGVPGVVHQVVVDTSWFTGNFAPEISVDATWVDGNPSADELAAASWRPVVPRSPARGDSVNSYPVGDRELCSHVRLNIFPDGGVSRLRVLGTAVADPRLLGGRVDLAALHHGGDIADCSNMFYSDARHVLHPGVARVMSDGWETSRRRTPGNDHLVVTIAGPARLQWMDLDTGYFLGNAPGTVRVTAQTADGDPWQEILPLSRVSPDAHNRFPFADPVPASAVRVDVYPDGGFSRLHLWGELDRDHLAAAVRDWLRLLPAAARAGVLQAIPGGPGDGPVHELSADQLLRLVW